MYVCSYDVDDVFYILSTCAAADFLMGVYLLLIGTTDVVYRNQYNRYALSWMDSWCCQSAGFLAVLSCEVQAYGSYQCRQILILDMSQGRIPVHAYCRY